MMEQRDWRLDAPDAEQLMNAVLHRETFLPHGSWDHEHCALCWEKISQYEGDQHEGYVTADGLRWVCEDCFLELRMRFQWREQG